MPKPKVPVINWSNPITKGLIMCVPFLTQGTKVLELISKTSGTVNGTYTGFWTRDIFGNSPLFNGSNNYVDMGAVVSTATNLTSTRISVSCLFKITALTDAKLLNNMNGATNGYGLNVTNTGQFRCEINTSVTGYKSVVTTPTYNDGSWHFGIWTYDGANIQLYVDGVAVGAPTAVTGNILSAGQNMVIGTSAWALAALNFQGKCDNCLIWNRVLSPQEIKQLYTNPWQIYNQPLGNPLVNALAAVASAANAGWRSLLGVGQ